MSWESAINFDNQTKIQIQTVTKGSDSYFYLFIVFDTSCPEVTMPDCKEL